MDVLTYLYGAMLVVVLLIAVGRRCPACTTALFVAFCGLTYAALVEVAGRPKAIAMEWWQTNAQQAAVLGSSVREGEGVYLYLQLPGVLEPRSYRLPWSRQTAEALQKAQRDAQANGGNGVMVELPFEKSLENRAPKFYPIPQPARPEKPAPDAGPQVIEREA